MDENDARWPPVIKRRLISAGWYAARNVNYKILEQLTGFPAALNVLNEFGGLEMRCGGASIVEIISVVHTQLDEIRFYEVLVGKPLFPIALVTCGDTLDILIDPDGHVYVMYPYDMLYPLASTFDSALRHILADDFKIDLAVREGDLRPLGLADKRWTWPWNGPKPTP